MTSLDALLLVAAVAVGAQARAATPGPGYEQASREAQQSLVARHGAGETDRIARGTSQVLRYWRVEDGDPKALAAFLEAEFIPTGVLLDQTFDRFEFALERVGGYMTSLGRDLRRGADLEIGPLLPLDERLAAWSVGAHVSDDLFASKIAFVALLNFPLTTLDERLARGTGWSRRQWAEARLAGQFQTRVPADVNARLAAAYSAAESYIAGYNLYMHHVLTPDGQRLFPAGQRLITHWNLRDELKARYADPDGLARQRMLQLVMERIVRQEIPAAVIDNPLLDWTPATGAVAVSPVKDAEPPRGRIGGAEAPTASPTRATGASSRSTRPSARPTRTPPTTRP